MSKHLSIVARDNGLWRARCWESSFTYKNGHSPDVILPQNAGAEHARQASDESHGRVVRTAAQWDPSDGRKYVNWYAEYLDRCAPIFFQWFEEPRRSVNDSDEASRDRAWPVISDALEAKGIGLFKDRSYGYSDRVISPLEDGSICIWDLNHSVCGTERRSRGRVAGLSNAGLLMQNSSQAAPSTSADSPLNFTSMGDCVSIDSTRQRAYVAVGANLNEVDINTLQTVSSQKYPWSIFALSQELQDYDAPLTVATTLSLNLYDSRCSASDISGNHILRVDARSDSTKSRLCAPLPADGNDFASLCQPGALSVTHTPLPNINSILIAGRFPSVLLYDRRFFPRLQGAAHSGARLSGSIAIPASPQRHLSGSQDWTGFHTVVTCGEYNGRGSLELYGLSAISQSEDYEARDPPRLEKNSVFQNRQSASRSKLLSVASHGTRLAYSDANGNISWVERDARTPVRSWNINKATPDRGEGHVGSITAAPQLPSSSPASWDGGDVIRKILPTGEELDDDEMLVWTGSRIGRLRFSKFDEYDGDAHLDARGDADGAASRTLRARQTQESDENQRLERDYMVAMDRSLRSHTDQLSWMPHLGFG